MELQSLLRSQSMYLRAIFYTYMGYGLHLLKSELQLGPLHHSYCNVVIISDPSPRLSTKMAPGDASPVPGTSPGAGGKGKEKAGSREA